MAKLNVYLNFAGNTEEAFEFYRSVFGGKFEALERFKDMPKQGGKVTANEKEKILNISLPVDGNTLMASDTLGSRGQKLVQGNNFYISITPESKQEANRIFKALSEDGRVILDISDQPWNAYYGSFVDKFGIRWMVNYAYPKGKEKAGPDKTKHKTTAQAGKKVKAEAVKEKARVKAAPVKTRKVREAQKQKVKAKPAAAKTKKTAPVVKNRPKTLPASKRKTKAAPTPKNKSRAIPPIKKALKAKPADKRKSQKRELAGAGRGR